MEKKKIKKLVLTQGLSITDLIDVVVDLNGIIGVGLVTLGKNLDEYCKSKIKK